MMELLHREKQTCVCVQVNE